MEKKQPDISIITVVLNSSDKIERTLKSVISQKLKNFEYILIDGGSSDGTLEIIGKYSHLIDVIISEPDNGLYDAMNKGLKIARGKFVWFINAGDEIAGEDVTAKIAELSLIADIIYSDTMLIDKNGNKIGLLSHLTHNVAPENLNWKKMRFGMVVCHQSFIVKKTLAPEFDIRYRLSSDIDWVIKSLKNAEKIVKSDMILSYFMQAGLSKKHLSRAMWERFLILNKYFGLVPNLIAHVYLAFRFLYRGRTSKV